MEHAGRGLRAARGGAALKGARAHDEPEPQARDLQDETPGEPRYGWILVGLGVLSIGLHSAVFTSQTLFLVAISEQAGWPRAEIAGAISLFVLGNGIWAPVVGSLIQRWGPRRVIPTAAAVLACGFALLGQAGGPSELALPMLLLLAPGVVGVGSLANYAAIQSWFTRRRGLAISVADCGSSFGAVLLVPLVQWVIGERGWQSGYQSMIVPVLALGLLHLILQRQPPHQSGALRGEAPVLSALQVVRQPLFWLFGVGLFSSAFALQSVSIHRAAYLTDAGFSVVDIASAIALGGGTSLIGRLGFGWLSDHGGTTLAYGLVIVCLLLGLGCLVLAGQSGLLLALWLSALIISLGMGVGTLLFARRTMDVYGSQAFGSVWGLGYLCASVGGAAGTAATGLLFELAGTYLLPFACSVVGLLLSAVCMWALGRQRQVSLSG